MYTPGAPFAYASKVSFSARSLQFMVLCVAQCVSDLRNPLTVSRQIIAIVYSAKLTSVPDSEMYTRDNYFTGAS